MAIRHVVTRGYGNGTFNGTIAEVVARGYIDTTAATATLGGKVAFTELELVSGAQETTITLVNDTWVAAGATFNAQRQAIIDGFDSAQSEIAGWNAEIRDKEVVGSVVRTSNTVVTITWTASAAYDITSDETITATIPVAAISGSLPIASTPTIGVTADSDVSGGSGWRRRKTLKLKKPKEKKEKLANKYYEDTEEKYQEGTDYLVEKYTSPEFIEKIEEGKIEVAGVEVFLQEPIEVPKLDLAPQINEIKDDIEKEIAQLMRKKEIADYEAKKALYIIEMKKLEEMVYFVVFALLDED